MRAVIILLAAALTCTAQSPLQPFLDQHCAACHNPNQKSAQLVLNPAPAPADDAWTKILDKISSGQMPPKGLPRPKPADLEKATAWIQSLLDARPQPVRRVVAHRLNRTEYDNTIRDLLSLDIRASEDFPVDDSGYGFDNIGDVLALSPMLMEKYVAAAARLSRLAVFGEPLPPKPTRLARLLNRRSPDANDVLNKDNYFPYSLRGAMYGAWIFPADAEYEFRLRIANFRPDVVRDRRAGTAVNTPEALRQFEEANRLGAPPRKVILTVDGRPAVEGLVEGTAAYGYSRGEFTGRLKVNAGERQLRASFPELANLDDPLKNINPDKRRQLFVDYLEIVGPFNPSPLPSQSRAKLFVCAEKTHNCARQIIAGLIRRAYRRPVTPAEIDAKFALAEQAWKQGEAFDEGIRIALEAVLVSPHFLFRIEQPGPDSQLNDYELAARLSYFVWSSMPDDRLFDLAAKSQLRPNLQSELRRLLAHPKAVNLSENFAAQWLQLRNLGRTKPDPARFPAVDDELLDAMRTETSLFVSHLFQNDRPILEFLDAPFTFLNGPLARHYGIPGVDGEQFQKVNLNPAQRSGLLTQAAVLTVSSYPTRTSPPVRGKWVLENLLGAPPPPPPPDAPVLDESRRAAGLSMRARLEQHRKDPSCAPCHDAMDPIGFSLESYDAVGAYRTHEEGVPIDASGALPDGRPFSGAQDLKALLKTQPEGFAHNFAEKLLTFALGRGLERADRPVLDTIVQSAARDGYRFSAFAAAIVNSQPFLSNARESEHAP